MLLTLALFAVRKIAARETMTAWLRAQGVASTIDVQDFDFGRIVGRVRAGRAKAPDFSAGEATVTYGFRGLNFEVRSVTLRRPVLHARLHNGNVSLGALDPLLDNLRKRPPQPGTPQPSIEVQGGVLVLATDYGPIRLTFDGLLKQGRLVRLSAHSEPTKLNGPAGAAELAAGSIAVRATGNRLDLMVDAPFARIETTDLTASRGNLNLRGDAPYPDLKRKRLDGPAALHVALTAAEVHHLASTLDEVRVATDFQGHAAGWIDNLVVSGTVEADLGSAAGAVAASTIGPTAAKVSVADLRWTHSAGDTLTATPRITFSVHDGASGGLRLSELLGAADGAMAFGAAGLQATLTASAEGRGSWTGFGPLTATDAPELASLKRAARSFQITSRRLALGFKTGNLRLTLPEPVQIRAPGGALLTLAGRASSPLLDRDGGAFRLTLRGGSLPKLDLDIRRLQRRAGTLTALGEAKASGGFGPIEGGSVDAFGTLRIADGGASFTAGRCVDLAADRIVFGANDVDRAKVSLCPWGEPMFRFSNGTSHLHAKAMALKADAPFLQARIADGAGSVSADQSAGQLSVRTVLSQAQVVDEASQTRFRALQIGGAANFADARWTARFKLSTPAAQPVAEVALLHDVRDGRGGLTVDTGELIFAAKSLQPDELSPLAVAVRSPVEGRTRFAGRIDWTPAGVTSGGTLSVSSLDFRSPVGRVSGLNGTLAFRSLEPLIAEPGQTFSADSIIAFVPVTAIRAGVGLDTKALTLTGAKAEVGGGRVRIESLSVPIVADTAMAGVLSIDGVQLHDLVEATPFGDRVDLDAKVSGRVPFSSQAGKIRVAGAELHAVQPGRVSINRQALTGVAATGSITAPTGAAAVPANNTFTDFAYQAMENLAFDKLDAAIDSRADGRLAILAHIVGRFDPPTHQEINLSFFDLIGRKFMTKPLPLPSDTGVDLTLDTSLNLDDLLKDYSDYQQLRSSPPVQPTTHTTETKTLETPR